MSALDALHAFREPLASKHIDLAEPRQRTAVAALYGGEESMKEHFPLLHDAFAKASALPLDIRVGGGIGQPTDFADGALIDAVSWEREGNHLIVRAATSLLSLAYFIDEHLEVRTSAGEIVGGLAQSTTDACHSELVYETEFDPARYQSDILEIDYASNWVQAGSDTLNSMLTSKDVHTQAYLSSQVKEIHVLKPVKKTSGRTAPINICYNRLPLAQEDIDYLYQESFNPITGVQRLFAPVSAWVEFVTDESGNQDAFKRIDITTFSLKMDCQNGIARYDTTGRTELVEHHFIAQPDAQKTYATGVSFELDPEWKADVPSRRWPKRDRVDMLFSVEIEHASGKRSSIEISTASENESASTAKADWMNLLWGCLAKGSKILLADGSQRCIEDVRIGDRVVSDAQGSLALIRNIIRGTEDRLVVFSTVDGRQLSCTSDHPIVTSEGILPAKDVHGDCRLYGPAGEQLVLNGIWDTEGGVVYNLELEDNAGRFEGLTFFADGIQVGDNAMQGLLAWKHDREAVADNPFLRECELKRDIWSKERS